MLFDDHRHTRGAERTAIFVWLVARLSRNWAKVVGASSSLYLWTSKKTDRDTPTSSTIDIYLRSRKSFPSLLCVLLRQKYIDFPPLLFTFPVKKKREHPFVYRTRDLLKFGRQKIRLVCSIFWNNKLIYMCPNLSGYENWLLYYIPREFNSIYINA